MLSKAENNSCALLDLPVELLSSLAKYFPLYSHPQTSLSLALTSRRLHTIFLPILHSHLILRNEGDALPMLQRIISDPTQGSLVRGIHIYSTLSPEVQEGLGTRLDVARALERVIMSRYVPFLSTLELHFDRVSRWVDGDGGGMFSRSGELRTSFWSSIRLYCPRLHALTVSNIGDIPRKMWVNEGEILKVEGIRTLSLRFLHNRLGREGNERLLRNVANQSLHLRHLHLAPNSYSTEWMDLTPYWALDFPCLEHLELTGQVSNDTSKSMDFWRRHPSLERLHLCYCEGVPLFSDDLEVAEAFLPKLKHLTADFTEIRRLVPLLPRLDGLGILESQNAQVPYLLRSVINSGLPNLRSLDIAHDSHPHPEMVESLEGLFWYESLDGTFREIPKEENPHILVTDPGWLTSIARGAPNLEELSLATFDVELRDLKGGFTNELSALKKLKRFMFGNGQPIIHNLDSTAGTNLEFIALAKSLAARCHSLEEFGDGAAEPYRGYFTAKIVRNEDGMDVRLGMGRGLVIGQEDQAFPKTRPWGS